MGLDRDVGNGVIILTPDCVLRTRNAYGRMAGKAAEIIRLEGLSRRRFADWLVETVFGFEGRILWPDGTAFAGKDSLVDEVIGGDDSGRWVSALLALADAPPRQRPQKRIVERLRMIDLAFQIAALERSGRAED